MCLVISAGALSSCGWLKARRLDFVDCFPVAIGVGGGLAVEAQVTDWVSPGVGFLSHTVNAGAIDRELRGFWEESDVITTPRIVYELYIADYRGDSSEPIDERGLIRSLALQSLNLPNERWVRTHDDVVSVEYFALLNFSAEPQAAGAFTGLIRQPGEPFRVRRRSVWERDSVGFGATVGFFHVRLGWSLLQTCDFLAGLFGFDPAGDDPEYKAPLEPRGRRALPDIDSSAEFPAELLQQSSGASFGGGS